MISDNPIESPISTDPKSTESLPISMIAKDSMVEPYGDGSAPISAIEVS